jgi:hypothetical protein
MVGSGRRIAVALIGVLVLMAVSVWIVWEIHASANPAVYGIYIGLASLLVPLLASLSRWWWKGRRTTAAVATEAQLTAAADQLSQRMNKFWQQQATERRISTPAPVRVWWRWGSAEVTPPPAEMITTPVSGTGPRPLPKPSPDQWNPDPPGVLLDTGVVTELYEDVYCKLGYGRLVLLGGPGAGKTGAMILLLLAALEHRRRMGEARRGDVPVPVWLTLSGWDPTKQTLHQWAATTMYRDHPYLDAPDYGPDAATELLRAGHVALFLDGFDEMAPSAQSAALARIEQEGVGLRIVLSSRPEEYQHAVSEKRVHNTAVIELRPVEPEVASAYLVHGQTGPHCDQWVQLGEYLTDYPDSTAAQALNNPLMLSLARMTYQNQDPTPLRDPAKFTTVESLHEHLIDRILLTAYPDERQRAHATYWLAWIAHHLGSDRDLAWWRIYTWILPAKREPEPLVLRALTLVAKRVTGLAVGLAVGLTFGLTFGLTYGLTFGPVAGLMAGLTFEVTIMLVMWLVSWLVCWFFCLMYCLITSVIVLMPVFLLLLLVRLVVGHPFALMAWLPSKHVVELVAWLVLTGALAGLEVWEVVVPKGWIKGFHKRIYEVFSNTRADRDSWKEIGFVISPRWPSPRELFRLDGLRNELTFRNNFGDGFSTWFWVAVWVAVAVGAGAGVGLGHGFVVGLGDGFVVDLRGPITVLVVMFGHGLMAGLMVGLLFGLGGGLVSGLGNLLEVAESWVVPRSRTATATPTASYRIDRQASIAYGFAAWLVSACAGILAVLMVRNILLDVFGIKVGHQFILMWWLGTWLLVGIPFGLAIWLDGESSNLSLTEFILTTTGAGRVKFIRLLKDAHYRQVLRQTGAVYQFRHAELQDHLAKIHDRGTQS